MKIPLDFMQNSGVATDCCTSSHVVFSAASNEPTMQSQTVA
jgi:hypothetical protein